MIWKKEAPARLTEALVEAHEHKVQRRRLRDELAVYDGRPGQVREVTGQDPLEEDE